MNETFVKPERGHYVEIPVTLVIEHSAMTLLRTHAVQQGIPLEQLLVQYIGRCGKAVEQRSFNEGILADCFDPMIRRNSPAVPSTCTCSQLPLTTARGGGGLAL